MLASVKFLYQYLMFDVRNTILQWTKPGFASLGLGLLGDLARNKTDLILENTLLRQQLIVLSRAVKRPPLRNGDRLFIVLEASRLRQWKQALLIVQPDTVLRWHRHLFRLIWKYKSRARLHKAQLSVEAVALILQLIRENGLWGAERIRGELLKLGIKVSKRTIQRYIPSVRGPQPRSQTWSVFLRNHAQQIWCGG